MRKKKTLVGIISLVLLVTLLVSIPGCSSNAAATEPSSTASQQTYKLKIVSGFTEGHTANSDFAFFTQELAKRSNNRIQTEVYLGTLGTTSEFYDMVKDGVVDIVMLGDAWAPNQFPLYAVNMLPFEYPNWWILTETMVELTRMGYFSELDPFKLLYIKPTLTMYPFFTDKKVTRLEDLKGLVLRSSGGSVFTDTTTALGATAKSLPGSETYMALSTGQVRGVITAIDNLVDRKFYETCKYGIKDAPIWSGTFFMLMNKDSWNRLPADLQLVIDEVSQEAYYYFARAMQQAEEEYWVEVESSGLTELYTIGSEEYERWKQACANVASDWAASMDAKGMKGTEILEQARKIVARYTE